MYPEDNEDDIPEVSAEDSEIEFSDWEDEGAGADPDKLEMRKRLARLERENEALKKNPPKSRAQIAEDAKKHFPGSEPFLDLIPEDASNREFIRQAKAYHDRATGVDPGSQPPAEAAASASPPTGGEETAEQRAARLEAEVAQLRNAQWGHATDGPAPPGHADEALSREQDMRARQSSRGLGSRFGEMLAGGSSRRGRR